MLPSLFISGLLKIRGCMNHIREPHKDNVFGSLPYAQKPWLSSGPTRVAARNLRLLEA